VLMIAHRPFVLSNADNLIVMNGGTIERAGPREDVLEALRQAAQVRPDRPAAPGSKVVPMATVTRSTAP
jgi:ABC-type protease/lipase transport system fused ATPase/permease subunit